MVNGGGRKFFSRQKVRFSANSPGNLHFENPVKYNLRTGINDKGRNCRSIAGAVALEIA
jgi:hypothetical protein